MHIYTVVTIMMLSTSLFVIPQEEPRLLDKENLHSQEHKDLLKAQMARDEFAGDRDSEEYKALNDDAIHKEEAFLALAKPKTDLAESVSTENVAPPAPEAPALIESAAPSPAPVAEPATPTTPIEPESAPQEVVIPESPEPVAEEAIMVPEEEAAEEPTGIDTVSLENPQGNWLHKRIWWDRAQDRYEKIRQAVDTIWTFRNKFFVARNELDRNVLDPFYINNGIDRGELQANLTEIVDFIDKKREEHGELSEEEMQIYETYQTEEEALKQLKSDVDAITNLDHAIDDALGKLMDQINRVRNYEAQAWTNFKEIAHILNDVKARELYYMIEGAARNIKNINVYLEQDFFRHFNQLIADTAKHVARVQSQVEALKEKGISFKKQADLVEQKQQQAAEEEEEEEAAPKPKLGWFDWIGSLFSDFFSSVWSVIRMPYDMIFGK